MGHTKLCKPDRIVDLLQRQSYANVQSVNTWGNYTERVRLYYPEQLYSLFLSFEPADVGGLDAWVHMQTQYTCDGGTSCVVGMPYYTGGGYIAGQVEYGAAESYVTFPILDPTTTGTNKREIVIGRPEMLSGWAMVIPANSVCFRFRVIGSNPAFSAKISLKILVPGMEWPDR